MSHTFAMVAVPSRAAQIVGLPGEAVLKSVRTFRSNHGHGFTATLVVGGQTLGTLEDDGNGGGVWLRPVGPAERTLAATLVKDWYESKGEEPGSEEGLWNDLVEEALTAKDLKKKGVHAYKDTLRITHDEGDWSWDAPEYATFPKATEVHLPQIKAQGFTHYWNGSEWAAL